jgi:hypothetical protein
MDKKIFIEEATKYYALAIAIKLPENLPTTKSTVTSQYTQQIEFDFIQMLPNGFLWDRATEWLKDRNMLVISKATFGPALYIKGQHFEKKWNELIKIEQPFSQYNLTPFSSDWLEEALYEIKQTETELQITADDYSNGLDEWQPIAVDLETPKAQELIQNLSNAAEALRKDNGYAATFPEEREFVIEGINRAAESVRNGQTTAGILRSAVEKLTLAANRFKGAAIEVLLTGARQATIDFVKQQGGELLRLLKNLIVG